VRILKDGRRSPSPYRLAIQRDDHELLGSYGFNSGCAGGFTFLAFLTFAQ
jgi:hypothetical protein